MPGRHEPYINNPTSSISSSIFHLTSPHLPTNLNILSNPRIPKALAPPTNTFTKTFPNLSNPAIITPNLAPPPPLLDPSPVLLMPDLDFIDEAAVDGIVR